MEPLVDVNIAVYNQAPYIRHTINSVLNQKTNFPFRLLIGDDCSTDGSTEILKEYEKQFPKQIKVIYQKKNLGLNSVERNGTILLKNSTAKYIALLDGDDYWISKRKLQLQVDFLEKNSNYSMSFHDVYSLTDGKRRRTAFWDAPDTSDLKYLLSGGNYIPTLSVVFRNDKKIFDFLQRFPDAPFGDYLIYIGCAQQGLIKFFPQKMGVYRVHKRGVWSAQGFQKAVEHTIQALHSLYEVLALEHKKYLKIQFLSVLEEYFRTQYWHKADTDNVDDINKTLIKEMEIDESVIDYIRFSCQQKRKYNFYLKNVPPSVLWNALIRKPLNRISI
jgi:glycosyltransferase involved in cell wall biosynthesis